MFRLHLGTVEAAGRAHGLSPALAAVALDHGWRYAWQPRNSNDQAVIGPLVTARIINA